MVPDKEHIMSKNGLENLITMGKRMQSRTKTKININKQHSIRKDGSEVSGGKMIHVPTTETDGSL